MEKNKNITSSKPEGRDARFLREKSIPFFRRNSRFERHTDRDRIDKKIVSIRKVGKVTRGGRRFSFKVLAIAGDRMGNFYWKKASARERRDALRKALFIPSMKRHDFSSLIRLKKNKKIVEKFKASKLILNMYGGDTKFIRAGGFFRDAFDLTGVKGISAKLVGSSNPYNLVYLFILTLGSAMRLIEVEERRAKRLLSLRSREKKG